jgi:PAS domain S-box-containing protein
MNFLKNLSFKKQLVIGSTLILSLFISFISIDLIIKQNNLIDYHYEEEVEMALKNLSLLSVKNILESDYAGLQEIINLTSKEKDFNYVMIILPDGKVISHSDEKLIGKYLSDSKSIDFIKKKSISNVIINDSNIYDVILPITSRNETIGYARIGLYKSLGNKIMSETIIRVANYTILAIVIAFFFFTWIANLMSRQIEDIITLAKKVETGERNERIKVTSQNELGKLSEVFNSMLDTLVNEESLIKSAKDNLQKSDERFELAMKATNDGIWDWDLETDTVIYSYRWKEMLGYIDNEIENQLATWKEMVHPDDLPKAISDINDYLNGKTNHYQNIQRIKHKNGNYIWILDRGIGIKNSEGKIYRMVGTQTDLTEQRNAELEKEQLYNQLRQSQKMEAVGQLTGGIAHDFNNILAGIIGFTDLGLKKKNLDEKTISYLFHISKLSTRARDLVRQMLIFSRGGDPDPKIINVPEMIEETIKMLNPIVANELSIETHFESLKSSIKIDQTQLQQVIMNLAINARDAKKNSDNDKGTFNISISSKNCDHEVCSSCGNHFNGNFLEISMKDNGSGIDPQTLKKIFEPFFTTKAPGKGTGMGLSMVHGITHRHNGHIVAKSTINVGTEFKFYFPEVEEVEKLEILSNQIEVQKIELKKRVLVVDDEEFIRDFTTEFLSEYGLDPITARNGREALDILEKDTIGFDLIITDYTMPEMNGIELIENIRKKWPHQLIILSSGNIDIVLERDFRHLKIDAVLVKPYEIDDAINIINNLLSMSNNRKVA